MQTAPVPLTLAEVTKEADKSLDQLQSKHHTSANIKKTAREPDTGSLPGLGRARASEALEASSASQQIQLGPYWASSLVDNPAHLQT